MRSCIHRCDHSISKIYDAHIKRESLGVLTAASGVWNTWISSSFIESVAVLLWEFVNLTVPRAQANAAVPPVMDHCPFGFTSVIPETSSVDPAKLFYTKDERWNFRCHKASLSGSLWALNSLPHDEQFCWHSRVIKRGGFTRRRGVLTHKTPMSQLPSFQYR